MLRSRLPVRMAVRTAGFETNFNNHLVLALRFKESGNASALPRVLRPRFRASGFGTDE